MNKPYIKNGTPVESEQMTMGTYVHPNLVLPFTVNTCSGYYDKNRPSWQQMEELAIDIVPGPLKPVGFKIGATEPLRVKDKVTVQLDEHND